MPGLGFKAAIFDHAAIANAAVGDRKVIGITIERKRIRRSDKHASSACKGKVKYRYAQDATKEAKRLRRERPAIGPLSVYCCEFCGKWHVGKATKTILARLQVVSAIDLERSK